jgi:bifunctional ADP-heptose synthase (sugar kinase/adenylyltransferase)
MDNLYQLNHVKGRIEGGRASNDCQSKQHPLWLEDFILKLCDGEFSPKVLVAGDLVIDRTVICETGKLHQVHSAIDGAEVFESVFEHLALGGAAVQAKALKSICPHSIVKLLGILPKTEKSCDELISDVKNFGVITSGIIEEDVGYRSTKERFYTLDQNHPNSHVEIFRVDSEQNVVKDERLDSITLDKLIGTDLGLFDAVLINDLDKGCFGQMCYEFVTKNTPDSATILVDPKRRWNFKGLDIDFVIPNLKEAYWGTEQDPSDPVFQLDLNDDLVRKLVMAYPRIKAFIIKRGRRGASIAEGGTDNDVLISDVPTVTVEGSGCLGAGDVFDAGFLAAILSNTDNVYATIFGNICAARRVEMGILDLPGPRDIDWQFQDVAERRRKVSESRIILCGEREND